MSKNKNKNKKKQGHGAAAPAAAAAPPAVLAEQGEQAMHLGRFREAVEIFKKLARQDPQPQWNQRLADAYAGRARALAEKGMFKEAAIVLENTMAPDGTVREPVLYLTCLIRQGQYPKAVQAGLKQRGAERETATAARLAELLAALWLAAPLSADKVPADLASAELRRAATAALAAWVEGKGAEEIDALLARIPLRSPFGPLRVILKSLIMPADAAEKSLALLARIPAVSAFATFRTAAEAALAADDAALVERWSGLTAAQQAFVAETRGLPEAATGLLKQILDAEKRGPAALFAVLAKPGLPLPEADLQAACLNLLPQAPTCLPQFERRFAPLSELERNRILALAAEAQGHWWQARDRWEDVAESLAQQPDPDARLAQAVVYRHLAELARRHAELEEDGPEKGAVADYLERSLELDPDDLPATLALIAWYSGGDSPKDWQRVIERAARQFPENTAILLQAIDAAATRNAYKKAADTARRLLTLDPINQPARQRMIELQLAHARKQMRSGRADLAGKTLAQAAEWEQPNAPSAALRIGQALIMQQAQEPGAEAKLREGVQLAGEATVGWFRAVLEAALMGWTDRQCQFLYRELNTARAAAPSREAILALVGMLGQREIRAAKRVVMPLLRRIDAWLLRGRGFAWSASEFQTIAACLHRLAAFDILRAYAGAALERDPADPAARFYRIVAQSKGDSDRVTYGQELELFQLAEQAAERQDFHMVNRVTRFMEGEDDEAHPARRRRLPRRAALPDIGVDEMPDLLVQAMAGMGGMPDKEIRKLVTELGRDQAIAMLADTIADSPLGEVLSDDQVQQLCAAMVARVTESRPQAARR
jgi:tetratricopeptide (TPR) repeat protein